MNDISIFMVWFLVQMLRLFTYCIGLLGSITFLGTSLLKFIVYTFIIGVALDIIVVSVRSRSVRDVSKDDKKNRKGDSNDNK